jgi:TPP-dependent pyruvate/acetoin dehydrogenase alpha subunit
MPPGPRHGGPLEVRRLRIRELPGPVMMGRDAHGLGRKELHELYRALCLTRAAEERLEVLQERGHLTGELYRSLGQEAGAVGAAFALRRTNDGTGDFLAPTVRAAGALFLFGGEVLDFFRQYMARGTGPTKGREANVHWFDFQKGFVGPVSPLGTMIEVMAGITLSFRLRGQDRVGMVFDGDGASSTGAWHEGLNFAAVQRCPMILVVENNQWTFSTSTHKNTRVESFTEKGPGYGIGAESVDGTDVLAVFDAVRRAAALARAGDGVCMVELRYFRRGGDAQHDLQEYANPAEIAEWEAKDPIDGFRGRMLENEWATEEELATIESDEFERCHVASEQAIGESLPAGPDAVASVYSNLDATRPWTRAVSPDPTMA